VRALEGRRVRRLARLDQPLTLLAAHPHLLGERVLLGSGHVGIARLIGHGTQGYAVRAAVFTRVLGCGIH
jgi:hypothetical protein